MVKNIFIKSNKFKSKMKRKKFTLTTILACLAGCVQPQNEIRLESQPVDSKAYVVREQKLAEQRITEKDVIQMERNRWILRPLMGLNDEEYDASIKLMKDNIGDEFSLTLIYQHDPDSPQNDYMALVDRVGDNCVELFDFGNDGYILDMNDQKIDRIRILSEGGFFEGSGEEYPDLNDKFVSYINKYNREIKDFLK